MCLIFVVWVTKCALSFCICQLLCQSDLFETSGIQFLSQSAINQLVFELPLSLMFLLILELCRWPVHVHAFFLSF